jgi:hypothetical protein
MAMEAVVGAVVNDSSSVYVGGPSDVHPGAGVGPVVGPHAVCGNSQCEAGENVTSCLADCRGAVAPPHSTGGLASPGFGCDVPCDPSSCPPPGWEEGVGGSGGVWIDDPTPADRIPAIVSVASTLMACVAVVVTMVVQAKDGVVEGGVGVVVPGVGLEYGGVGGGALGLDLGLFQVVDVGQFVVQSGQLSGAGTPWVVKYFVEYFTPFTGLLPLVRRPSLTPCLNPGGTLHSLRMCAPSF